MTKTDRTKLAQELSVVRTQSQALSLSRSRRQGVLLKPEAEEKALKRSFLERLKFWSRG